MLHLSASQMHDLAALAGWGQSNKGVGTFGACCHSCGVTKSHHAVAKEGAGGGLRYL